MRIGRSPARKLTTSVMVIVIVLGLVGCTPSTPSQASKSGVQQSPQQPATTTLKLSYPVPATGTFGRAYEYFAKTVAEESQGRVTIRTYPSGTLVADQEVLEAVRKGNVDIAHCVVSYATPVIKDLTPLEVPGCYKASRFSEVQRTIDPIVATIYNKYGVKFLGSFNSGTLTLDISKRVGKVIKSPAHMKGFPIRTYGKWSSEAIKAWGGTPTAIPLSDVSVGLERGTIMGVITAWAIADSMKLHEQAPYITFMDLPSPYQGLIMSENAWNGLDDLQKEALGRAVKKWQTYAEQAVAEDLEKFRKKVLDVGGTLHDLNEAENAAFMAVVEPILEQQVRPMVGQDGLELIKMLATLR